jgi:hypothetical protein
LTEDLKFQTTGEASRRAHAATPRVHASASTDHAKPARQCNCRVYYPHCVAKLLCHNCKTYPFLGSGNCTGATHSFHPSKQVYGATVHISLSARVSAWSGVHSARWWHRCELARTSRPSYTWIMVVSRQKLRRGLDACFHATVPQHLSGLLAVYLSGPALSRFRCIFSRTFQIRHYPPSLDLCSQPFTPQSCPDLLRYKISHPQSTSNLVACQWLLALRWSTPTRTCLAMDMEPTRRGVMVRP